MRTPPTFVRRLISLEQTSFLRAALLRVPPWITPNGVTTFRLMLALPVIALIAMNRPITAAVTLAVSLTLDAVDGWLARVRNARTPFGAEYDPLADKATITTVLMGLLFLAANMPLVVKCLCVAIIIMEGGIQGARHVARWNTPTAENDAQRLKRASASWHGKLKMVCESVGVFAFVLAPLAPSVLWTFGSVCVVPALFFGSLSLLAKMRG